MPEKNQFRLQPVLNLTTNIVDSLELEFAQLKLIHRNEVELLEQLEATKNSQLEALQKQQHGLLDCEAILWHQQYLQRLDHQINRQTVNVQTAAKNADTKREELVETMKNQRTLEKLRDNHMASQRLDMHRREARIVDDLVTTRYGRGR